MHDRRSFLRGVASAAGACALPQAIAQAGAWPTRPIRIIVPSNPGSGSDLVTRAFANYLQARVKQSVYIDNKPGANTVIGAEAARHAEADGYTFFCSGASSHSASPALYSKLPYDPARDFIEVGLFGLFPYLVVVRKESPYKTVGELIDAARAQPGKLSSGYGASSSQVPLELLRVKAGVQFLTASYRAAPQVVNDIAAGVIDFAIVPAMSGGTGGDAQNGVLRPIGVTSAARAPGMPDIPAVAERLPGFVYEGWVGLSAPTGTPRAIVEQMNRHVRDSLAHPAMRKTIEQLGLATEARTLAQQAEYTAAHRQSFAEMVRTADIKRIN
ncbi:MAG TPA: tripartite tricarboxylate transporter substrate binding protein [Ramlibacter sp.]|nr:tripartite tricarboxylate transporter substrate binding protein [Ramlibacter sp.]